MRREPDELKTALIGIKAEITAGSVLLPRDDADRAWNDANRRACKIIDRYISGNGIFQTQKGKACGASKKLSRSAIPSRR